MVQNTVRRSKSKLCPARLNWLWNCWNVFATSCCNCRGALSISISFLASSHWSRKTHVHMTTFWSPYGPFKPWSFAQLLWPGRRTSHTYIFSREAGDRAGGPVVVGESQPAFAAACRSRWDGGNGGPMRRWASQRHVMRCITRGAYYYIVLLPTKDNISPHNATQFSRKKNTVSPCFTRADPVFKSWDTLNCLSHVT